MIRKMILSVAAILILMTPGAAQVSPPSPAKASRVAEPPRVPKTARAQRPELTDLPQLGVDLAALPALPEIPSMPMLPALPALPELPALPALPDLSGLSALAALPAIDLGELDGPGLILQEQSERAREQAERAKENAERIRERAEELKEREQERLEREEELYDDATEAMDEGRWEKAAEKFAQVAEMKGKKADAALYWKAYSENKAGRRAEAITTLTELQKNYPKSNYLKDAKALELEVRTGARSSAADKQNTSPTPKLAGTDDDCELKLLAINGLLHQNAEQAVPMLEKLLQTGSTNCPKARKQALFVLAQSGSPRAREVMEQIARGKLAPDLQREAINNLGIFGGHESRAVLKNIYETSSDTSIKKRILQSFMVSGEKEFLLTVARNEKDPELRAAAVQQLGVMGAREELWQMYQQEVATEVKAKIINAMFVGGDTEHMIQLAKSEKDADLRKKAINYLGLMGGKRTGDALVELYTMEKDTTVRKAVLNAFFLQGNARQLIEVARKETDPDLKRAAVQKLSLMNSKEATDFLMEILNKP
jgi:tetratricopeptide (TPR) repeat protein